MSNNIFKAVIFDMDDTLISSKLDFKKIRDELGLSNDVLILDHIKKMPKISDQEKATALVEAHELAASKYATIQPGVPEVLAKLEKLSVKKGLFTRNSKEATERVLENLNMKFDQVITRSCAPAKPDPAGLMSIVQNWKLSIKDVLYVGDFIFDIQAGKNAGIKTALYTPNGPPNFSERADFQFSHFNEFFDTFSFISI